MGVRTELRVASEALRAVFANLGAPPAAAAGNTAGAQAQPQAGKVLVDAKKVKKDKGKKEKKAKDKDKKKAKQEKKSKKEKKEKKKSGKAKKKRKSSSSSSSSSSEESSSASKPRLTITGVVTIEDDSEPAATEQIRAPEGQGPAKPDVLPAVKQGAAPRVAPPAVPKPPARPPVPRSSEPAEPVAKAAPKASKVEASKPSQVPKPPSEVAVQESAAAVPAAQVAEVRSGEAPAASPEGDQEMAPVEDDSSRRLLESALYKEDLLIGGHGTVWGSFYDPEKKRWGYKCCQAFEKGATCTQEGAGGSSSSRRKALLMASEGDTPEVIERWENLSAREEFAEPEVFLACWIKSVLGEWKALLLEENSAIRAHQRFGTLALQEEAEKAITPLLRLLESSSSVFWPGEAVHVFSVGHNKWMKDSKVVEVLAAESVVTGSRTPADGSKLPQGSVLVSFNAGEARKWVAPSQFEATLRKAQKVDLSREAIDKLDRIATLAAEREYHAANQAYIELTIGRGKWHEDLSIKGLTGCNKAPRGGFKVKKDQSNFLETEEAKEYMFCLKRLLAFLQVIRPNEDVSKHCT